MRDALQSVADSQMEFDEAVKWEEKVTGLPTIYADGKSRGDVKMMLRKLLKRPDDIISIEKKSLSAVKQIRRGQAAGTEPGDEEEDVKEELLVELEDNRIIKVKNKELTNDDIVNMIQFGHPFVVDEEIPAELPGPEVPRYKNVPNSVVDKEDKKANKAKARAERDILIPTQTQEGIASGAGKVVGGLVGGALGLGVNRALGIAAGGGIMKAGAALQKKLDQRKEKLKKENRELWLETSDWAKSKEDERKDSERLAKQQAARDERYLKITKAGKRALKKGAPTVTITKKGLAAIQDDVEIDEGNVKGRGEWMPYLGQYSGEKERVDKQKKREAQAKDKRDQAKAPVGKQHEETDIWDSDPKKDKVTKHQARRLPSIPKIPIKKPRKSNVDFKDLRPQFGEDSQDLPGLGSSKKARRTSKRVGQLYTGAQVEVAPPGWGHTKAEKEKTKPNKPKSKIGGSAHEFDKDLKSGKFKGLPGDKTMKDKKASMFKIMWSAHNKKEKPHYKSDVKDQLKAKYKKDENVLDSAKRYLDNG